MTENSLRDPAPVPGQAEALDREFAAAGVGPLLFLDEAAKVSGLSLTILREGLAIGALSGMRTRTAKGRGHWRVMRSELARFLCGEKNTAHPGGANRQNFIGEILPT